MDPLVDETGQPYGYTGDNPVNGVDPSGLISAGTICGEDGPKSAACQGAIQISAQVGKEVAANQVSGCAQIIDIAGAIQTFIVTHKAAIIEVAVGTVVIIGATVLTAGVGDALLAAGASTLEAGGTASVGGVSSTVVSEAAGGAAATISQTVPTLETADLVIHAPFVLLPGATLGGLGALFIAHGLTGEPG